MVAILFALDRLLLHACEHFVGQVDLSSVVFENTTLFGIGVVLVHAFDVLEECLEVAFFHF